MADCQEEAISLGELIKATEGADAATIPLLEAYCEQLFRIHTDLCSEEKSDVGMRDAGGINADSSKDEEATAKKTKKTDTCMEKHAADANKVFLQCRGFICEILQKKCQQMRM